MGTKQYLTTHTPRSGESTLLQICTCERIWGGFIPIQFEPTWGKIIKNDVTEGDSERNDTRVDNFAFVERKDDFILVGFGDFQEGKFS